MKKITLIATIIVFCITQKSFAQNDHLSSQKSSTSIGIGLGIPFGGIGLNVGTNVIDNLNVFGGVGYLFAGVGYNIGLRKDFPSESHAQFYLTAMYGTNAGILVEGSPEFDKLYTGFTPGLGVKLNSKKKEGNFWNLGILVPIASDEFKRDEKAINSLPGIELRDPLPIAIVIGYHFNI